MSIGHFVYPALSIISMLMKTNKSEEDKYDKIQERLDFIQQRINSPNTISTINMPTGNKPMIIKDLSANMIDVSKNLDEAMRFAREDGIKHPEVQLRKEDTKKITEKLSDKILEIERIDLSPSNIVGINPDEKKVIDHVLPQIRKLRQNIVNNLDNISGMEESAAMANNIATQLKVANAVLSTTIPTNSESYSKYAPEMTVDTGCIECGKAHIAMADITLRKAAELAQERGFANKDVQAQLTICEQELGALFDYDWTEDKIDKTLGHEKDVLLEYSPKVKDIYNNVINLKDTTQLYKLANIMKNTRNSFNVALEG